MALLDIFIKDKILVYSLTNSYKGFLSRITVLLNNMVASQKITSLILMWSWNSSSCYKFKRNKINVLKNACSALLIETQLTILKMWTKLVLFG